MFESVLILAPPIVLGVTFHEAAHAYVAFLCGDPTAKNLGRLSFNPLKHVDPVGTVVVPSVIFCFMMPILFGWAKPVPVAFFRLRHPRRDAVLVALAGPCANLFLAVAAVVGLKVLDVFNVIRDFDWLSATLFYCVDINVALALFNMIPLPPLDGGRVLRAFLLQKAAAVLDRLESVGVGFAVVCVVSILPWIDVFFISRHFGETGISLITRFFYGPIITVIDGLLSLAHFQNLRYDP